MDSNKNNKKIAELTMLLKSVAASFNTLFQTPVDTTLELKQFDHNEPFSLVKRMLQQISSELLALSDSGEFQNISSRALAEQADSVDYLNALIANHGNATFAEIVTVAVLDIMTAGRLFEIDDDMDIKDDALLQFQLKHARIVAKDGTKLLRLYFKFLSTIDTSRSGKIRPEATAFLKETSLLHQENTSISLGKKLREKALESDSFKTSRVFRCLDGEFIPAEIAEIRPTSKFFGYSDTRRLFKDYFSKFSTKNENFPLLITSLPGLGKTHMTISHALSFDNLALILPEPEDIERPLEKIIRNLSQRKNRKFVLFFDDIDTRKVNWYYFRTFIGGSYMLPSNICIVIASNLNFPANISSRGRGFSFPIFDEIVCQQMVGDFLHHMGMSHPPSSLVSVIAADYVEQFAQHAFEELSPRTLVRYLERYNQDMKKRTKMLELSRGEVITKPDAQIFFETNQKVKERLLAF
ncbi:MAG: hypothetical protein GXP32_05925 [Kiritimatiellaeota bacterium]|nr:hypothetical protein [Kiritimatiellota bacterium]